MLYKYWQLLAVTGSYWQLLAVTGRYWQLLAVAVTGSYWQLLTVFLTCPSTNTAPLDRPSTVAAPPVSL